MLNRLPVALLSVFGLFVVGANNGASAQAPTHQFAQLRLAQSQNSESAAQLLQEGVQLLRSGEFQQAIAPLEAAFVDFCGPEINEDGSILVTFPHEDVDSDINCIDSLGNLGIVQAALGNYQQAARYYDAVKVFSYPADEFETPVTFSWQENLAFVSSIQSELSNSGQLEVDDLLEPLGSRIPEASNLRDIVNLYLLLGQYEAAIAHYQDALNVPGESDRTLSDSDTVRIFNNIGLAHSYSGQFDDAENFYRQALDLAQQIEDSTEQANILGNIGINHYFIGDYNQAIFYHLQSLEADRAQGNQLGAANSLNNLASAYSALDQPEKALEILEEGLSLFIELEHLPGQANALANQGIAYEALGQPEAAIQVYQEALAISQRIGNQQVQANLLNNLGIVLQTAGRHEESLDAYQQALVKLQEINDRRGEGINLSNIGQLYEQQGNLALAIAFYKQSVNLRETIRQEIANPTSRQAYTNTVADTYRRLADLLLAQGRVLEAQQVLELLKLEEIQTYTDDERTGATLEGVGILPQEATLLDTFGTLVAFGKEIEVCEAAGCDRIAQLRDERDDLAREYQKSIRELEALVRDRIAQDIAGLNPENFETQADEIIAAQPGTAVIYPVVLEDKLWLLWATEGGVLSRREVPVSRQEIGESVVTFRTLLEDRHSEIEEVQAAAQQLYTWLIAPLEDELATGNIQHLVFSLDRTTRYIPIAALYDGERYLVENYTLSTILSAALTDTSSRTPTSAEATILAAGVAAGSEEFPALAFVPQELDGIVREVDNPNDTGVYPSQQLLDERFSFQALRDSLEGVQFLHIATHGAFVPGDRDASYLLMGNGEKLPIPEIEVLKRHLRNVHLVVLSACQTGLGGPDEEGLEIAGLGYYFLKSQADAVMASLWNVNDASTSQLMQRFYENLAAGTGEIPITKAEALQHAQLAMLGSDELGGDDLERFILVPQVEDGARSAVGLAHPYYWAPFILIGNGL